MRTIEITLYQFDELSDSAKKAARNWFLGQGFEFAGSLESLHSIKTFCRHFGITLTDWACEPHERFHFRTDATSGNFREMCLNQFDRNHTPTGYYLDCALWQTFVDEWKRTDGAKTAFNAALEAAFTEWQEDMRYQLTNESIDENIKANEYEFLADGSNLNNLP